MSIKILIIALILISVVSSVSVCPGGSISYDTFNLLAEDVLRHRSVNYDVFYRMSYDAGVFNLNCHRVADQQSTPDPILSLQNITLQGDRTWKIQAVSQRGSCVVVKQGSNITAYYTFSGSFVQVQTADISSLGKKVQYSTNDDCNLVRAIVTDNLGAISTKLISSGEITDETTYPTGTIFSYDFKYALDGAKTFYVSTSGTVTQQTIQDFKTTPVYIKWSSLLKAVITVSTDDNGYSLVLVDPANSANTYSKTFVKGTDYNGTLKYVIRTAFGSILFRDDNGFVDFIQFSLNNSLLVGTEHTFDNSTYASLFTSSGQASVSNDILFAYHDKKVTYFQAHTGVLYYLGQLPTDIETTGETYRLKYSAKQINIVLALTASTVLNFCSPIPVTQSSSTINAGNTQTSTVVNTITGQTLKCPDNCVTCTSTETCTICRIGYSLNEATGKCVYCNGCLSCNPTNINVCYLCFAPEVLNRTSSTCVLPQCTTSNCLQCDINAVCTKCTLNYGLINNQCQKCSSPGCRSCSSGVNTCDSNSCMLGYAYYLNPSTGNAVCQPCASGCNVCLTSDLSACSSCSAGYYPQADSTGVNRCVTCFANCKICSSAAVCTTCIAGYIPSTDGSSCTLKCNANCLTCSQSNAKTCLTCFAGSVLNTTTNICDVDMSCNATSTCLFCGDGYVLSQQKCWPCSTTDANCISCLSTDVSTCADCVDGYYLKQNQCLLCSGNCAACVGLDACYKCNDGYFLVTDGISETGVCSICDASCLTCSGTSTTCTSCANGFSLQGSKCISANRVILQFVIQANVNNFIEFMQDLINWLVVTINQGKTVGSADITSEFLALISTQKYGSSIVTALAGAQTSTNANSIANALNTAINNSPSVNGYLILSGSATAQTTDTTPTATTASSSNLGVILGIVLPLGLILLVVIGIVSYKVYQRNQEKRKSSTFETDAEKYSQKQFTYSQEKLSEKI